MKIAVVTPWLIEASPPYLDTADDDNAIEPREYTFVEVNADKGITGWGEVTAQSLRVRPIYAGLKYAGDLIGGDDPRLIEMIWKEIFRAYTYMGSRGLTTNMISALVIALWDIRGKALWLPISELFGGPLCAGIPIYCHPRNGSTPEERAQHASVGYHGNARNVAGAPWAFAHPTTRGRALETR